MMKLAPLSLLVALGLCMTVASRGEGAAAPPTAGVPGPGAAAAASPFAEPVRILRERAPWIFDRQPLWAEDLAKAAAADQTKTPVDHAAALDQALRRVSGDRARFYTPADQMYFILASKFGGSIDASRFRHVGAIFERRGKRWFVRDVLGGGPAQAAGLERGDEIVDVDGAPLAPVGSFIERGDKKAKVRYRRLPWDKPKELQVATEVSSMGEALLASMRRGARTQDIQGKRIAYLPLPAASAPQFRELLQEKLAQYDKEAAALVLDLRGDFGGGDLTLAEPFEKFAQPIFVLVDGGTRGGREALAWFLRSTRKAKLVGAPTAGDAEAGIGIPIAEPTGALWVPIGPGADAPRASKVLKPDAPVDAALVYAAGSDAALDEALKLAAGKK